MVAPISGPIDLKDKVALVTGGARGIGQAISIALAREGADVAIPDRLSTAGTVVEVQRNGRKAMGIRCDVTREDQVKEAVQEVIDAWGHIDILINNAAILGDWETPLEDFAADEWDEVIETNLRGTFIVTQTVWPHMVKQREGKIVCLGSVAGRIGGILAGPHYSVAKGGVHTFVKWVAKRGAPIGIYANGIAPGPIRTPMISDLPYSEAGVPLGRIGEPQDIAEVALFLASQASNYITGSIIDVNGGLLMA
jgi:3-oxoacyl-[acyl-carrier protein] reductase